MKDAPEQCPRETREDLIDSLIAVSLLTQRIARSLINLTHCSATNTKRGGKRYGKDERTGRPAYRVVRV